LDNLYFSKKVGYDLREPDELYFHAMFSVLDYTGLRNEALIKLMYNTRGYLIYNLSEQKSEIKRIDSYKLLSYGLGLYYEQFSFRDADRFKHYLLRNLKMRLSVPLLKINTNALGIEDQCDDKIYVFCVGCNENNNDLVIIHPLTNEYHVIPATNDSKAEEYEFILLNFPDMSKPKMIPNFSIRVIHYYDSILNRKINQSSRLFGYEAVEYMERTHLMDANLKLQIDMINHLEVEVNC